MTGDIGTRFDAVARPVLRDEEANRPPRRRNAVDHEVMTRRRTLVAVLVVLVLVTVATVWALATGLGAPGRPAGDDGARPAPSAVGTAPPTAGTVPSAGPTGPRSPSAPEARIAVAGDTGTGDQEIRETVDAMVAREDRQGPYDALVLLGDIVYDDGDASQVDERVTDPFAPVLDTGAELVPVLGNHDVASGEQNQILADLGRSRGWYVQEVGRVRIVVLDSNRVDDAGQTRWLEKTLAADVPPGTWTVVALHHPPFSAGEHGSDMAVREEWVPLFEKFGVPLVLAGHDHDYQRSRPIDGVTYVVSGGAAKLRPTGREDFTEVSTSTRHFLDLAVYGDRLVGRAVDQSGRVLDEFTIPGP
ncbi:3',5'-cyclic AMP phosphodiesterase CpdA [Georgenia soli]|uniref:3',5'-cyclic AMP phosphodiesterase CpdA n=1 Tax=Georgenia soli TaxID=638953 RepID=A0A2A9EKH3_9MICO|nr:3',5'-cyclic AMP phosphodiesterase CpdA [Georgenia soli]